MPGCKQNEIVGPVWDDTDTRILLQMNVIRKAGHMASLLGKAGRAPKVIP